MSEAGEYRFKIDAFTPLTLPMKRLHEYMADLIDLFGNESSVHFMRVEEGSAVPAIYVEDVAVRKVERRFLAVRAGSAPNRAMRAYALLNDKLADDNAVAELLLQERSVIQFPGREREVSPEIGPLSESGTLEGEIIQIGGRDETISVYLRDGERIHICTASREEGRRLAHYLWTHVRVRGQGHWKRTRDGIWSLDRFLIDSFVPLTIEPVTEVVQRLRAIESPELASVQDPMRYLDEIRREAGGG